MGTIATFGLFAVAFLVRPFGGLFFGPLADRIGRNKVLATTMILMALGTFAIGCIPSRAASIGMLAPALLLVARLVQGFSTGGEYGNAMTFIAEYAPDRRRGFLGSWLEFGTFTGYLLGAIVVTVADATLTDDQLLSWGWRIPFFVALPLGIVGVYLRTRLADTPAFLALEKESEEREKANRTGGEVRKIARAVAVRAGLHGPGARLERHQLHADLLHADLRDDHHARRQGGEHLRDHLAGAADRRDGRRPADDPAASARLSDRIGRKPIVVGRVRSAWSCSRFPMILLIRAPTAPSTIFARPADHGPRC